MRNRLLTQSGALLIALAAFSFVNMSPQAAQADVVIDDFSSGPSSVNAAGPTTFATDGGQSGLTGVVGGASTTRTLSVSKTSVAGGSSVSSTIGAGFINSGVGASNSGQVTLNYGISPSASLAPLFGVSLDVLAFNAGTSPTLDVMVTYEDGNGNTTTGTGQITGVGELIIPAGAFPPNGVDFTNIVNIDIVFNLLPGQEVVVGTITSLTPEPMTLLLWGSGIGVAAIFWRRYGKQLRPTVS